MKLKFVFLPITLLFFANVVWANAEVSATQYFTSSSSSLVNIRSRTDVIVFNAKDNARYVTNGRPLVISANTVKLIGDVKIRIWPEGTKGADQSGTGSHGQHGGNGTRNGKHGSPGANGGNGTKGPDGGNGANGADVILDVGKFIGEGTLRVITSGQDGGKGGIGGNGGNGGNGANGRSRGGCNVACGGCDSPGNGGRGGNGGNGGAGGNGGKGGNAGNLEITYPMCSLIGKTLFVELDGGVGGQPNTGGAAGSAGSGGGMGRGNSCGGGGKSGTSGSGGNAGQSGSEGSKGNSGRIVCNDRECQVNQNQCPS